MAMLVQSVVRVRATRAFERRSTAWPGSRPFPSGPVHGFGLLHPFGVFRAAHERLVERGLLGERLPVGSPEPLNKST